MTTKPCSLDRRIAAIVLLAFAACHEAYPLTFTLCIANGHYSKKSTPGPDGFIGWANVPGALASAQRFNALMRAHADDRVDSLFSSENRPLSRKDIMSKVSKWVETIVHSGERDPLLVIYYCGHGISDTVTHAMFLPPGDVTAAPWDMDLEERSRELVNVNAIKDVLYDSPFKYLVLLDCCYDGDQALDAGITVAPELVYGMSKLGIPDPEFNRAVLTSGLTEMWKDQNIFSMYGPGLFAVEPGKTAALVYYPFTDGHEQVGPLCARSYAIATALQTTNGVGMTVREYMAAMLDPGRVPGVPPAFTGWTEEADPKETAGCILFTQ